MYAALDAAERVRWSAAGRPLEYLASTTEKPYLAQRGISMYTMQRAYFESGLYDRATGSGISTCSPPAGSTASW